MQFVFGLRWLVDFQGSIEPQGKADDGVSPKALLLNRCRERKSLVRELLRGQVE